MLSHYKKWLQRSHIYYGDEDLSMDMNYPVPNMKKIEDKKEEGNMQCSLQLQLRTNSEDVHELYIVPTITVHSFGLESPNLQSTCILGYSQLVLKMEVIDRDLQGHFDSKFCEIQFVYAITRNGFELESPKMHQMCILGFPQLVMKMGVIYLDFKGHLTILTQNSRKKHLMCALFLHNRPWILPWI